MGSAGECQAAASSLGRRSLGLAPLGGHGFAVADLALIFRVEQCKKPVLACLKFSRTFGCER
jgi:hypothetical protein